MGERVYKVNTECQIWDRPEEVFFREVMVNGNGFLEFLGCDHDFHGCEECERCKKEAYEQLSQG